MLKYIDKHVHYTGSLPLDFIWQELAKRTDLRRIEPLWKKLFRKIDIEEARTGNKKIFKLFQEELKTVFSESDFRANLKKFFKIYLLFQNIVKPNSDKKMWNLYSEGTFRIATKMHQDLTKNFEIIAGSRLDKSQTKLRFEAMIDGLKKFEEISGLNNYGSLRITFIRNNKGDFRNLTPGSLSDLFHLLDTEREIAQRTSGFDFSGEENLQKDLELFSYIDQINDFNNHRKKEGSDTFPISVHAGETLGTFSPSNHLLFFDRLLRKKISSVGHGTFLWMPSYLINLTPSEDRERQRILRGFAKKEVEFEICPTANLTMSPLESYSQIPMSDFDKIGLKYSINSDNKTIFLTNSKKEYQSVLN